LKKKYIKKIQKIIITKKVKSKNIEILFKKKLSL